MCMCAMNNEGHQNLSKPPLDFFFLSTKTVNKIQFSSFQSFSLY